jgi:Domain of unknown function (DUF4136)
MRKNKQIKTLLVLIFAAVTSLLITSCYPDYGLTVEDFDIVATFKDDAANFQLYKTYFMPDSIKRLADGAVGSSNTQYDAQILQEIRNQMTAYGYQTAPEQLADVKLFVGITTSTTYAYYPGYWYGYYGWYYPWYGYGGGYTYAYSSGSLFLTMFDPDKMNTTEQILGAVWSGTLNGVLDDTQSSKLTRTLNGIDKMFNQSPYLKLVP